MTGDPLGDQTSTAGYDVIGDIHGYGGHLEGLLLKMGYRENGAGLSHPNRQAVFVGDLVDRGPNQLKTVGIVRTMVEAGAAKMVLGNHEINAIGYTIPNPEIAGEYVRIHSARNRRTHSAFLDQFVEGSAEHAEAIAWFRTLPIWLDLGGIRVVHACWHEESIDVLRHFVDPGDAISNDILISAPGSPQRHALSILTRGPEIPIHPPYVNQSGGRSSKARFKWWSEDATTMDRAVALPDGARSEDGSLYRASDSGPVESPVEIYRDAVPVLFGHYWWKGTPARISPYLACLDYSVAGRGPLVAYRWQGEGQLLDEHFVQFGPVNEPA